MKKEPDLLEAHYKDDPWKMMVACILLNRTRRTQVDGVIGELFKRWNTPIKMVVASKVMLSRVLRPLGLYNRRAESIIKFTRDYLSFKPYEACYGMGEFSLDALRIFYHDDINFTPKDKELRKYVKWRKSNVRGNRKQR